MIDAGRFSAQTAYAAVNTLRIDDMRPYIYRTHDGGKTWTEIVGGMEGAGAVNAVREDPKKRGLLYASTENGVYVSFDDGERWQSLRLNLPASSVRDLIVKDDDVAVATHGRGFWILDDITPLRQIDATTAARDVVLFKPAAAWRVRWNTSTDMPWPKDEPTMPNPPEGTAIDYYLKSAATGPITLEILTTAGRLVRRYSSADPCRPCRLPRRRPYRCTGTVHRSGFRPTAGMHRFHWDLRYQPLGDGGGGRGGLVDSGDSYNTAPAPATPLVAPGTYTVKLTVNGTSSAQPMTREAGSASEDAGARDAAGVLADQRRRTSARSTRATRRIARGSLRTQVAERLAAAPGDANGARGVRQEAGRDRGRDDRRRRPGGGRGGGRGGGAPAAPPDTLAGVAACARRPRQLARRRRRAADGQSGDAITAARAVAARV